MQTKDATSNFGRVGLLIIPLILIFLATADSALACPGHNTRVAYRTTATKARSAMPTTVISYRAPASYSRCANNTYVTREVRYATKRNKAIRLVNDDGYLRLEKKRYGAVYDVDYGDAPRRFTVRNAPVLASSGTRYVMVRRVEPRVRYVAVRHVEIDDDDEPRYVAVRHVAPRTRYVSVRNAVIEDHSPRYVAIRNSDSACARTVALRSCLGEPETRSVSRVIVRAHDVDDDEAYSKLSAVREVSAEDMDAVEIDDEDIEIPAERTYVSSHHVIEDEAPVALSTRTVRYTPVNQYDDIDTTMHLDNDEATYVAVVDGEDACMPEMEVSASRVSYVPEEEIESDAELVVAEESPPTSQQRWVALDEDGLFNDPEPAYVAVESSVEADEPAYNPVEAIDASEVDAMDTVPEETTEVETVGSIPVENAEMETVSYIPVDEAEDESVSYVPVASTAVETVYVTDESCPIAVSSMSAEPVYVVDNSTIVLEAANPALTGTQAIAGQFGYRDGFEDGQEAALEGDVFHPENSGDYKKATEGYEDDFGDKGVYKDAYRSSYLEGYRAGFDSGNAV